MVVCTYFQQGNCRNGQRCRFEHVYASRYSYNVNGASGAQAGVALDEKLAAQISSDATEILRGGVWPLTGYLPFRDKSEFPGLLDVSPEESRHMHYEARNSNALEGAIKYMDMLTQDAKSKYEQLLRPSPTIMKTIRAIYNGEKPSSPFNNSSSIFGNNSMLYPNKTAQSTVNAQSVFAQGASNPQSVFAQGASNPQSVFAQGASNPQSVFAQGASNPQSVFAQGASNAQSVFAQGASNAQSVFAQGAPNAHSVFSQSSVNPQSVFSQLSNVTHSMHSDIAPSSVFGNPSASAANQAQTDETIYGTEEELSEEDMSAFTAEEFTLGKIPLLPPPAHLCH